MTDAKNDAALVRAYLADVPPDARRELRKVRAAIRAAVPDAVEGFSYRMPMFRLGGRPLVWYAAFTNHLSLFPMGAAIRRAFAADLDGCGVSTGTIRCPLSRPPTAALVKRLVKARVAEVAASAKRSRTNRSR